jgi:hypothetical protein
MPAFNAVRFKVKPGREQEFLDAHKKVQANWPGLKHANMIKTGDRTKLRLRNSRQCLQRNQ